MGTFGLAELPLVLATADPVLQFRIEAKMNVTLPVHRTPHGQ
jgi:hypothetical protein